MRNTMKIALGGVITALAVVCMLVTSVIPVATYSCPILSGMLLLVIVIEINSKWAFCVYSAISILSILIVPDKEAVVYFVTLFGYYPILKQLIERRSSKIYQWILKLIVFNVAAIAAFFVTVSLLNVPKESFSIGGVYLPLVFLIAGNFIFILYDTALSGVITMYITRLRKYILKRKW